MPMRFENLFLFSDLVSYVPEFLAGFVVEFQTLVRHLADFSLGKVQDYFLGRRVFDGTYLHHFKKGLHLRANRCRSNGLVLLVLIGCWGILTKTWTTRR